MAIELWTTIGELKESKNHWRQIISTHARKIMARSRHEKKCAYCGYEHHVEVCHLKPVSEFGDDAGIILEVNNVDNLVYLCPNHHFEFDQGHIEVESIRYHRGDYGDVFHDEEYFEYEHLEPEDYENLLRRLESEEVQEWDPRTKEILLRSQTGRRSDNTD